MNWDINLFLLLNFDGGAIIDAIMTFASGKITWAPLYILLIYLVWRKGGAKRALLFILCVVLSVVVSDMIAGIFKHAGVLKNVWSTFPVRLRPMHTPEIEGMFHVLSGGSRYGTVSAHAATTLSIAIIAAWDLRKRWLTPILFFWAVLVSYSRIYLAFHFPQDILLGWVVGIACAIPIYFLYKKLIEITDNRKKND